MNPILEHARTETRRHFFARGANVVGAAALATLLGEEKASANTPDGRPGAVRPHFAPKAKHVIYLHMVGGPPQMDLFDYKPGLRAWYDRDLPPSVRGNQRLTTMTSGQARFPIAPSKFPFRRFGKCGMWMNEMFSNLGRVADEVCFIRSMNADAINHEPAIA